MVGPIKPKDFWDDSGIVFDIRSYVFPEEDCEGGSPEKEWIPLSSFIAAMQQLERDLGECIDVEDASACCAVPVRLRKNNVRRMERVK